MKGFGRGFVAAFILLALIVGIYAFFSSRATSTPNGMTDCGNGVFVQPGASCPNGTTQVAGSIQQPTQPGNTPVQNTGGAIFHVQTASGP